jgi:hypothetical protein
MTLILQVPTLPEKKDDKFFIEVGLRKFLKKFADGTSHEEVIKKVAYVAANIHVFPRFEKLCIISPIRPK